MKIKKIFVLFVITTFLLGLIPNGIGSNKIIKTQKLNIEKEKSIVEIRFCNYKGKETTKTFEINFDEILEILKEKEPVQKTTIKLIRFLNKQETKLPTELNTYLKKKSRYPGVTIWSIGLGTTRKFMSSTIRLSKPMIFWDYCPSKLINNTIIPNIAHIHKYNPNLPEPLQHHDVKFEGMQLGILFGFKHGIYIRIQAGRLYDRCLYVFYGHGKTYFASDFLIFETLYEKWLDLIGYEPQ